MVAGESFVDSPDRVLGGPVGVPDAKIRAPRPKFADVRRERLLRTLADQPLDILAVLAPGGYGKSTLVSQWAECGERPQAWISLDPSDSDPVVLISSILRSLHEYLPDLWGRTGSGTGPRRRGHWLEPPATCRARATARCWRGWSTPLARTSRTSSPWPS